MTPLQVAIIGALFTEAGYLSIPAIAHRLPDPSAQRYSDMTKDARALVSEGLLSMRRTDDGDGVNTRRPTYQLTPIMREALERQVDAPAV